MEALACLVVAALALVVGGVLVLRQRRRRKPRTVRIPMGADAASFHAGQQLLVDGKRREALRVVSVAGGAVEVERLPPPTAATRGAGAKEAALLRALGFDPATHDVRPVLSPFKGVQVFRGGERVRFFTAKQVKARALAWKTALRGGEAA